MFVPFFYYIADACLCAYKKSQQCVSLYFSHSIHDSRYHRFMWRMLPQAGLKRDLMYHALKLLQGDTTEKVNLLPQHNQPIVL